MNLKTLKIKIKPCIEYKEVVILDKDYTKEDIKEFIEYLESEKLTINDFRYID